MSWAFLTRSGSESDLVDELNSEAEIMAEGLVSSDQRPRLPDATYADLAFARQAMLLDAVLESGGPEEIADVVTKALSAHQPAAKSHLRWCLQVVAADGRDPHDPRRGLAQALGEVLPAAVRVRLVPALRAQEYGPDEAQLLAQIWVADENAVLVGVTPVAAVPSVYPGGKPSLRRPEDAVSRSGLKLEEATIWLGIGPEKGDNCVDLGAAPGGWTQVAIGRGAHVLAIDPAKMKVRFSPKQFSHLQESAFTYAPDSTMDWLLCDMAWRPLEVAQLLAKWGRRGWARQMIVNIKLPMKKKAEMVQSVVSVLREAGWQGIRKRQLFHNRDEVTIAAWLDPRIVARGPQPAFFMRSRAQSGAKPKGPKTGIRAGQGRSRGSSGRGRRSHSRAGRSRPR